MDTVNRTARQTRNESTSRKRATKMVMLMSALLGTSLSGVALAERTETVRFADEVDSCVSAVNEHIDLSDANRVRHTVVEQKHTGIGYALSIETSVFAAGSERRFSAYCVANGSGTPLKFRIDESVG